MVFAEEAQDAEPPLIITSLRIGNFPVSKIVPTYRSFAVIIFSLTGPKVNRIDYSKDRANPSPYSWKSCWT